MFEIGIPFILQQIFAIFYLFGLWNKNETSLCNLGRKSFYFVFYGTFIVSIFLGALESTNDDERSFLAVWSVIHSIHLYRIWFNVWRQKEILSFVHEIGRHYISDRMEFHDICNKLEMFMKFVRYFLLMVSTAVTFMLIVFPVVNPRRVFVNIAFPLDRSNSEVAVWLAYGLLVGGLFFGIFGFLITIMLWYIMLSFSFKYELLGNQFRRLGMLRTSESGEQQELYREDFIEAMRQFDKING